MHCPPVEKFEAPVVNGDLVWRDDRGDHFGEGADEDVRHVEAAVHRGQVTPPILATLASNLLCLCIARPRRQAESRAEAWNGWRPETSGAVQCGVQRLQRQRCNTEPGHVGSD